jgi:diaminopropionate ammonia-lyase
MKLSMNPAARRGPFQDHDALSAEAMRAAAAAIAAWPGYRPTPLRGMPGLAARLGVGAVGVKLEAERFEVGSFKALGPPYALQRALAREGGEGWRAVAATSGNHGRALAWGAARLGAGCTIFMPAHTSAGREAAIRRFGAEVVRVAGDFDASLAAAAAAAEAGRTMLVADLPWRGSDAIPRDILAGYSVLAGELAEAPTHLFVAAGNGSLAAATAARLWLDHGAARPVVVAVEPVASDAVRRSLAAGERVVLAEGEGSVMDGLVVRAPSALCWPVLRDAVDAGLAIGDGVAVEVLRAAARDGWGDGGLEIGETGIAALAGLVAAAGDAGMRAALGLGPASRVVAIACEGVTDRAVFDRLLA